MCLLLTVAPNVHECTSLLISRKNFLVLSRNQKIMNIKLLALVAAALCCLGFSISSLAGQKLDVINQKVSQQSNEIDNKYGVLLDYQERNDLRLDLIAKQALIDAEAGSSVQEIAQSAFDTYEVSDPYEQRKLLIKLESQVAQKGTGNGGPVPDYP